jgi:death on curing protein
MGEIRYLSAEDILQLHYMVMRDFGEGEQAGVMFEDRLLSIVERPRTEVFGVEVFPTLWQKAGALVQSIVQVHPFYNGNKRTALVCLQAFLHMNGYELAMSSREAEDFIVSIAVNPEFKGDDGPRVIGDILEKHSIPFSGFSS